MGEKQSEEGGGGRGRGLHFKLLKLCSNNYYEHTKLLSGHLQLNWIPCNMCHKILTRYLDKHPLRLSVLRQTSVPRQTADS